MIRKKSDLKKWAHENMKGLENILFPSFTPDMKDLDEDGIRLDLQQSITTPLSAILQEYERTLFYPIE